MVQDFSSRQAYDRSLRTVLLKNPLHPSQLKSEFSSDIQRHCAHYIPLNCSFARTSILSRNEIRFRSGSTKGNRTISFGIYSEVVFEKFKNRQVLFGLGEIVAVSRDNYTAPCVALEKHESRSDFNFKMYNNKAIYSIIIFCYIALLCNYSISEQNMSFIIDKLYSAHFNFECIPESLYFIMLRF